jgi:hypothetical protein
MKLCYNRLYLKKFIHLNLIIFLYYYKYDRKVHFHSILISFEIFDWENKSFFLSVKSTQKYKEKMS